MHHSYPISTRWRITAIGYGILTHGLFALGVSAVILGLYSGLTEGRLGVRGLRNVVTGAP